MRYLYSTGNGNDGVSDAFPEGHTEATSADAALRALIADFGWLKEYGEPDTEEYERDGDNRERASAMWYEIDGAPALNGGAALIIHVWDAE